MEYAAYTTQEDHIVLYRLYGQGTVVDIPDRIGGKPVQVLADHLFAGEMSVLCPPEKMSLAGLKGNSWEELKGTELEEAERGEKRETVPEVLKALERNAYCLDRVEVIHIPEGVRQIGNYAFYGLYQLREISFPSTMQRLGSGLFNGCRQTGRLVFHLTETSEDNRETGYNREDKGELSERELTPPVMKEVLDSLSNEVDAIVMRNGRELYRLHFPHYYEEGKENTPARIIEIIYHGTGHQYRNCFLSRVLQFDRYDEIFPLSAAQESSATNVSLILNRLRSGPAPKEEAMRRYLEYLRCEEAALMEKILTDREFDPTEELRILDEKEFFTPEILEASVQAASVRGCTQAVSCLMEIRSRRRLQKKNRYEL